MTGDGGEYLRPEDLKELGDDSLPSSQFLDGLTYLRYSLEGGRSDRYCRRAGPSSGEPGTPFIRKQARCWHAEETPLGVSGFSASSLVKKGN